MRLLRLLPLLVLPALFLGATCVSNVQQKGPMGPWTGDVTNNDSDVASNIRVFAHIYDASGNDLGYYGTDTCPPALLPGETGGFELPYFGPTDAAAPLNVQMGPVESSQGLARGAAREGLTVKIVEKDSLRRYAIVEVTNTSSRTYDYVGVCANLRTPDGKVAAVGRADLFPRILRPGEKGRVAIFFDAMPDGSLELFPNGDDNCCSGTVVLDPSLFRVTATKLVQQGEERELQVVGDLDNLSGQDLDGVELMAYLKGEPAYPVWTSVGCGDGTVGHGTKAPASLSLPLRPGDEPSVVIAAIQGYGSGDMYPVPVSGVDKTQQGEDWVVSATLSNPTNDWLYVKGACFNLRAADGTLVGTVGDYRGPYLAPGASAPISAVVSPLAKVKTAEVVAYAEVQYGPPPEMPPPTTGGAQ